jgi:hypothetical protein
MLENWEVIIFVGHWNTGMQSNLNLQVLYPFWYPQDAFWQWLASGERQAVASVESMFGRQTNF